MQHFDSNLRRLRRERDLSQAEIARLANALTPDGTDPFSQAYLSLLERGMAPRDPTHTAVLARVLGTTEAALLKRPRVSRSISVDSSARVNREPVAMTA